MRLLRFSCFLTKQITDIASINDTNHEKIIMQNGEPKKNKEIKLRFKSKRFRRLLSFLSVPSFAIKLKITLIWVSPQIY